MQKVLTAASSLKKMSRKQNSVEDGPPDSGESLSERKEQAYSAFRAAIAEACAETQSMDSLSRRVDELVDMLFDREEDGSYPRRGYKPWASYTLYSLLATPLCCAE